MSETQCMLQSTRRLRVKSKSLKRGDLKSFLKIGQFSESGLKRLNLILDQCQSNDLGSNLYEISKYCDFEKVFNANKNYRQVLLQSSIGDQNENSMNEYLYSKWISEYDVTEIRKELNLLFNNVYRFRLSEMAEGHELNWHIDTDPGVIARAQICLSHNQSSFQFSRRGAEESYGMDVGGIYFVNTGWSHRVVNRDSLRRVAIFGFKLEEFKNLESLKV